jgi:glycine/D-amino acid oxidase-like deaminating enzyme
MGFTPDGMPLVGKLGKRLTGRPGDGEWAAVGFNGYGMDKCWLVGELLGAMIAGEDVTGQLPALYQITDERLNNLMAPRDVPARLFRL